MKKLIINITVSAFSILLFSGCNNTNESDVVNLANEQAININAIDSDEIDVVNPTNEWAIKINAIDTEGKLGNTNTRFGQVYPATDNVDRYDLESGSHPFGGDFMEVVYRIDSNESEFSTDYHGVKNGQPDTWTFVIKTNNPDRSITVSWPGIFKIDSATDEYERVRLYSELKNYDQIMEKMQLVDMKTGTVISAVIDGKVQSYTFNMDGETERTFKWELLSTNAVNETQDFSNKESAIELGKQYGRSYEKKMDPSTPPSEFD